MDCEECQKTGAASKVRLAGNAIEPLRAVTFTDDAGAEHTHTSGGVTASYACDAGHRWTKRFCRPCWCGWPLAAPDAKAGEP